MLKRIFVILMMMVTVAAGCAPQATPTATAVGAGVAETSRPLVLAEIGDEPSETIEAFQPLADYLAANLQEHGIGVGEVTVAPDLATMAEWMESGEVDIYFDSAYPALIVSSESGAQPILRRWKDGVSEYHTVFFARTDSGLETVDDLPGHLIAFEEEYSTSGYMAPLAHLVEAGLDAVELADTDASPAAGTVGYVFSSDDDNTIQWVVSDRVSVGVVDNVTYGEIPEETRDQLTIVGETEPLPRHMVVVRPDMEPELLEALTALLLGIEETEEGPTILTTFEDTVQFDEFPGGTDTALTRMRELYALVNQE